MVYRNISREEFEERISFFNDYCELLLKSFSVKKFGFKILDKLKTQLNIWQNY